MGSPAYTGHDDLTSSPTSSFEKGENQLDFLQLYQTMSSRVRSLPTFRNQKQERLSNSSGGVCPLRVDTTHLTTRADDRHAPPCRGWSGVARLIDLHHMFHRLQKAPVNSFEFQPCGRTSQARKFCVNKEAHAYAHPHFLSIRAWTTGVSNPDRSPRFRSEASVGARGRPAPVAVLQASKHANARPGLPPSPLQLMKWSLGDDPA